MKENNIVNCKDGSKNQDRVLASRVYHDVSIITAMTEAREDTISKINEFIYAEASRGFNEVIIYDVFHYPSVNEDLISAGYDVEFNQYPPSEDLDYVLVDSKTRKVEKMLYTPMYGQLIIRWGKERKPNNKCTETPR